MTNVDQLHDYLGQHEIHANEVRLMHEREGHMSKQCTNPKRKRDEAWFKDKNLKPHSMSSPTAPLKIDLMVNLSHYGFDNHADVHNPDNVTNNVINQVVQAMLISEQSNIMNQSETKITNDINIIPYSQYVSESQYASIQNSNIPTQQDALILYVIEQLKTQVVNFTKINQDNKSVNETLTAELERYKDQNSMNSEEPNLSTRPTQVEVPKELPKVSMVNSSLKKLKYHLASFDVTYKQLYESIKSSRIRSKEQCDDLIKQVNIKSAENSDLNASIQEKVLVITALKDTLRKLKGKAVVNEAVTLHPIEPELLKIDVAPLAPKLQNNRTAYYDCLKHTQEETATLKEIVENEGLLNPLNTSLDYACDKLMVVSPVNKTKKIRFTEPITSSGNTPIKTASSSNVVSNKLMLSSTGVNLTTSASGPQPSGNTKKDRI
nr:hypothetical protein [Tanacetum cinerariifolium]